MGARHAADPRPRRGEPIDDGIRFWIALLTFLAIMIVLALALPAATP